ncbi:MAG: hypothetical protein PUP92_15825, partial [Rhizonema sp. PD38]|nr:hypothetical protein [Rhizonema sp. PD38]
MIGTFDVCHTNSFETKDLIIPSEEVAVRYRQLLIIFALLSALYQIYVKLHRKIPCLAGVL